MHPSPKHPTLLESLWRISVPPRNLCCKSFSSQLCHRRLPSGALGALYQCRVTWHSVQIYHECQSTSRSNTTQNELRDLGRMRLMAHAMGTWEVAWHPPRWPASRAPILAMWIYVVKTSPRRPPAARSPVVIQYGQYTAFQRLHRVRRRLTLTSLSSVTSMLASPPPPVT